MSDARPTVVCIGIAVLDQLFELARLPDRAGKHFAHGFLEVGGGPAATAAVAIARLGGQAIFWGRVGDDPAGVRIAAELEAFGVDIQGLRRVPGGRSSIAAVIVDDQAERMIVTFADPVLDPDPSWLPLHRLEGAQAVLADLRWPGGAALVLKAARERELPGVLDADRTPDPAIGRALVPLASHVVFSAPGLEQATGCGDPAQGLRRAAEMTPAWLAVTLGEQGCLWLDGEQLRHQPAFRVAARDTVGAGDVFHGAFALALAEGRAIDDAVRRASAAAALKCTRPGGRAGIPSAVEVDRLIQGTT
jgi:sulfofructose kinase